MRKTILMLAAAIAALPIGLSLPTAAEARSCQQRAHDHRVAGTVIGAIGGALVGNAISHRNGALIGGLGGAVVGNQISRRSCDGAGYYYRHGRYRHRRYPASNSSYYYNRTAPTASRCSVRDVSFYDSRGALVTRQVQTCR